MMKFFLKLGVGFNLLSLSHGFLNNKFNTTQNSIPKEDTETKFNFSNFEKNLENFKKVNPQILNFTESNRQESINTLENEKFDILIIGGGCSGAGVLLESHRRGLKTGLIELNDFASGTSSRSTKLIHGGIRYLQDTFALHESNRWEKLKLVAESIKERDFLINSLPFMNNIVEIKLPFKNIFQMDYYYSGVYVYQILYFLNNFPNVFNTFPWPKINFKEKTISFFEGQMFDSRQCLLTILTCTRTKNINNNTAVCSNYIEFKEYIYDSNSGRIKGAKVFDKINKKHFTIETECIVNCTGIYADNNFNKEDKYADKMVIASKGTHIVLDRKYVNEKLKLNSGYMLPHTTDGRILFLLPYQKDYYLVGTTDSVIEKTLTPDFEINDIDYLKNELKLAFELDVKELDKEIKSKWAGLRPLVMVHKEEKLENDGASKDKEKETKSMARNHVIRFDNRTGLISLMGGKWTTYRKMGADVLDKIESEPQFKLVSDQMKKAEEISKFTGAVNWENIKTSHTYFTDERKFFLDYTMYLKEKYAVKKDVIEDLVYKYGMNAIKILDLNTQIKDNDRYILSGDNICPILKAELIYCIKFEMVTKPNDFICRRNGVAFVNYEKSIEILDKAADILGKELKWSRDRLKTEKQEALKNLKYFI